MKTKAKLDPVEYVNGIKQTIKPGDDVIIVTTGYNHNVGIEQGVYLGRKGRNNGCSCKVVKHRTKYRHKESGEDVGYYWHDDAKKRYEVPDYPKHPGYPTNPRAAYNSQEYIDYNVLIKKIYAEYSAKTTEYQDQMRKIGENYESFRVPYDRYTTLQLNRIYKLDTSVFDLVV